MVTRKRFRTVLNALALYTIAALVIGYFGVNAYSGNRGLRAKQDLDQQIAELGAELDEESARAAEFGAGEHEPRVPRFDVRPAHIQAVLREGREADAVAIEACIHRTSHLLVHRSHDYSPCCSAAIVAGGKSLHLTNEHRAKMLRLPVLRAAALQPAVRRHAGRE